MQQIVSKNGLGYGMFLISLPAEGANQDNWKQRRVVPQRPSGGKPWKKLWEPVKELAAHNIVLQLIGIFDTTPPAWPRLVISGIGVPCIEQTVQKARQHNLCEFLGEFSHC